MKKILVSIIFLLLIPLSLSVYADEKTGDYKVEFVEIEATDAVSEVSLFSDTDVPFEDFLYDALYNHKSVINAYNYRMPVEDAFDIIENVALKNPELMIYTSMYGYSDINGIINNIAPYYIFEDVNESREEYAKMEAWMDTFVSSVDKNLSDEEKILNAYYFIADNVCYSPDEEIDVQDPMIYTAYNAYKNGHCVCQGYTTLMCEILKKLDIECGVVPSGVINHIWNYVVLDGENYHLDITWDDLDYTNVKLEYKNFLLSDDARLVSIIKMEGEQETETVWEYFDGDRSCDSDKYESGYIWNWLGVITDITSCSRGYRGNCLFKLEDDYDTASFVFETIKIPDDNIIMSEISEGNRLFFYGDLNGRVYTSIYLAEYDENNRLTNVTRAYNIGFENFCGFKCIDFKKPDSHKINIMWVNSSTFAPLGRNVIME